MKPKSRKPRRNVGGPKITVPDGWENETRSEPKVTWQDRTRLEPGMTCAFVFGEVEILARRGSRLLVKDGGGDRWVVGAHRLPAGFR